MRQMHARSVLCVLLVVSFGGCAGPGPKLFPADPIQTRPQPSGGMVRVFDTDGDARPDFEQEIGAAGRIERLVFLPSHGSAGEVVDLRAIPASEVRDLVLLLDSTPYALVRASWDSGRFRYCDPPACVISPFPVMTDLSFCEFFNCSPSPGVESEYFDGKRLTAGYDTYASGGNVGWQRYLQYHMNPVAHAQTYMDPYPWFDHELRRIQNIFLKEQRPVTLAYCVGTSAVGAKYGREGHERTLVELDRYCNWLLHATRGRARLTLLSDHGHSFYESCRIPLKDKLAAMGYRTGSTLRRPDDIVVPEFGMVSCAVVHTRTPEPVARDVLKIEGMDLAAWVASGGSIVVMGREGRAVITRGPGGFRYDAEEGDPLRILPAIERLRAKGLVDSAGFVDDHVLFEATAEGEYPDSVYRIWRAFNGLVQNTPDVQISVDEGYHCGSALMTSLLDLVGVHGSLKPGSTYGFAMTGAGALPRFVRMDSLRGDLIRLGVEIPGAGPASAPVETVRATSPVTRGGVIE